MINLEKEDKLVLENIFTIMNSKDIKYVVLRGYEYLPEKTLGNDIDVFVGKNFDQVPSAAEDAGVASTGSHIWSLPWDLFDLVHKVMKDPPKAMAQVIESPNNIPGILAREFSADYTGIPDYKIQKYSINHGNIQIDFFNHLFYRSVMSGNRRKVNPFVEEEMLENRVEYEDFFVPSPPDELAHLVCRIVFDYPYKGEPIPQYYINRCDKLFDMISEHHLLDERLEKLLQHLFFDASNLVYDLIDEHRYSEIRAELFSYADY